MKISESEDLTKANSLGDFLTALKNIWFVAIKEPDRLDFSHWRNPCGLKCLNAVYEVLEKRISEFNDNVIKYFWHDYEALETIRQLFFNSIDGRVVSKEYISDVATGTPLYRMRTAEKYEKHDYNGIYVISALNSNIAGALRYNASGQPCLYLAESLYLAWEELRRPDFHTTNFACFKPMKKLKVLDLTIPCKLNNIDALFRSYVALACCAKAKDNDKHKWQYVIPNMFMQFLHYNQFKCSDINHVIDGIKYISSRRFECADFQFDSSPDSAAYVFPPMKHEEEHCSELKSKFRMTEAFSSFFYEIHRYDFKATRAARTSNYRDTLFGRLEELLQDEEYKRCTDVIKDSKQL